VAVLGTVALFGSGVASVRLNQVRREAQETAKATSDASQRTTDGISHARTAADDLARMSSDLQQIVARFQLV